MFFNFPKLNPYITCFIVDEMDVAKKHDVLREHNDNKANVVEGVGVSDDSGFASIAGSVAGKKICQLYSTAVSRNIDTKTRLKQMNSKATYFQPAIVFFAVKISLVMYSTLRNSLCYFKPFSEIFKLLCGVNKG